MGILLLIVFLRDRKAFNKKPKKAELSHFAPVPVTIMEKDSKIDAPLLLENDIHKK